jgi:HPt (histidine-containing phosphotransfer) domain-containing protein
MTESGSTVLRLVNPAVLEQLRSELDDDEGWLQFLNNFLAHLPRRMAKLRAGLETADYELSMDAVLSLKISCQMVGAERLADLAVQLQQCLGTFSSGDGDPAEQPELARLLEDIAVAAGETGLLLGTRAVQ